MRIGVFLEGSYPYVVGGVSQWMQMLIENMPEHEFVVHSLIINRAQSKQFKYQLPQNVVELRESYLMDDDWVQCSKKNYRLSKNQFQNLLGYMKGEDFNWAELFTLLSDKKISINHLLMGPDMLQIIDQLYKEKYPYAVYSDFVWTVRSMYLPLFQVMKDEPAKADLYHAISTGYAGIIASKAKAFNKTPLILTEHGIYTREREEEIIKADWTKGIYKDMWIEYFNKMSLCAYEYADQVISLYQGARDLQCELGCDESKTMIIPNGIQLQKFEGLVQKDPDDSYINIGSVLRITPIKDVKTMLLSYHKAKQTVTNLKLYLIGPTDENPEYFDECKMLITDLKIQDVVFTGKVDVKDYLGKMDIVILTSISEGQPLSIMEAMAAEKPCISTNVGSCKQLLYGSGIDELGEAGIITTAMLVNEIAGAIVTLAQDPQRCKRMGAIGRKRIADYYTQESVISQYKNLYNIIGNNK